MDGAIYILSRKVQGDHGESFMQNVTVFASSPSEAQALVDGEFARLRRVSSTEERPYAPKPAWRIDKISLNEPKVLTAGIT